MGLRAAKKLRERLADIEAALSVADLPAGRPRKVEKVRHPYLVLELGDRNCLILRVNHEEVPLRRNGRVDWSRVSRLKVQRLEVKHG